MYENIGQKIKTLAQISGWCGIISGAIIWLFIMADKNTDNNIFGWIWLVVGVLCILSSWPLYGFGQLLEDVSALRESKKAPAAVVSDELPDL